MKLLAKQCEKCGADIFRKPDDTEPLLCVPCQRGPGRPPIDGESAKGQIQLRVTMARKNAYVRAAKPKKLTAWVFEQLDKASGYEPTEHD